MTKKSEIETTPGNTAMSVLAPGAGVKEYEDANNTFHKQALDAAIDLALVRQGIDPQKVPKRVFDIIRRLNIKLNEINAKAQNDIVRIQQAAGLEYNQTILELNQTCLNLKIEQGIIPEPPVQGQTEVAAKEPSGEVSSEIVPENAPNVEIAASAEIAAGDAGQTSQPPK
jgi:hypothetical protein